MKLTPYLNFPGTCEEAFKFYEQTLGAVSLGTMHFTGSPMAAEVPEDWGTKVLHATLQIGESLLMGSDSMPGQAETPGGFSLAINTFSQEEATKMFDALAVDGQIIMPLGETFWAPLFGMVKDKYGVTWLMNCEAKPE